MSRVRRLAAISTAVAVAAVGTFGAATSSATAFSAATASAGAAAKRPTVEVHIGKGRVVHMPDTIRPGTERFVVHSDRDSGFQLIRPDAGYRRGEAARDINAAFMKNNMKALARFERNTHLLGGVPASPGHPGFLIVTLEPGWYWAVDTNRRVTDPRLIKRVHVTGERVNASPDGGAVLRAIHETDFAKRPRAISHRGRLTFRNDSTDNHFIEMAKLKRGKTMKDFARWVRQAKAGKQVAPPVKENVGTGTGVLSPGHEMTMHYDLPRGRYVMVCFWPDAEMGGMPHAFMGMYRGIRLR
jgi:hypothetical protein